VNDLEPRLENWGSVMRWRRSRGNGSTGSIEGGYRSPQHWEPWGIATPSDISLGWKDAEDVELAASCLSLRYHAILRGRYVAKAGPNSMARIVRKLGFHSTRAGEIEAALAMGKALLLHELAIPQEARKAKVSARILQDVQKVIDDTVLGD
jgi:hypothetical protein